MCVFILESFRGEVRTAMAPDFYRACEQVRFDPATTVVINAVDQGQSLDAA